MTDPLRAATADSALAQAYHETLSAIRITNVATVPQLEVQTLTDAATVTPDCDNYQFGILTSLSQTTTIANPTGNPMDGQRYTLRIKSSSSRSLSWGSQYRGSLGQGLPSATTGSSKTDYLMFVFDAADSKWDFLAKNFGF